MIAANGCAGQFGLLIINDNARADTITTSAPASFAQSLGNLLQTSGGATTTGDGSGAMLPVKAKAASNAALTHAELGTHDPQTLQAEIGTLFGVRATV